MKILSKINNTVTGCDLMDSLNLIIFNSGINPDSFLILIDKKVLDLYKDELLNQLTKLGKPLSVSVIEPGEKQKDILKIPGIIKPLLGNKCDRQACLISIGGGVVTDIGGFISAIWLRGIKSIFIPTTLLAQIDAAIGGKNGVNLTLEKGQMLKNMLGTFKQPDLIISDVKFLKTLPDQEIINGLGEMVKYHIGWGTPSAEELLKFKTLIKRNDWEQAGKIIVKCQKIKMKIVDKDPLERSGIRQKLNFGHTVGHAIEAVTGGKLSHGEAVGIGLVAAAKISVLKGLLRENNYLIIRNLISELGLPLSVSKIDKTKLFKTLNFDKKGGTFVLIKDIGELVTDVIVEQKIINLALNEVIL